MSKNSKKQDGRGRSPGSQAKQFSRERQPQRRDKRQPKIDPAAADLLHKMIYEKIPGSRNGKKVRVPFIDAFLNSMRRNVLAAKAVEQIRYFKELTQLGVFDFEDYKERLFRGMKNYYRKVVSSHAEQADLLEELGEAFKQAQILHVFYFTAFAHARQYCSCGACDRGLEYAEFIIPIFLEVLSAPDEDEPEESEGDDTPEGEEENGAPANPSSPIDKDDDDAFYEGFGFD
jgi:hypothetical protein